ncbi:MAG: cysteine desulfurase [Coriobacteriia bacterium]|nr:cysteine desulfurase [Coriobacteriia bacterium]
MRSVEEILANPGFDLEKVRGDFDYLKLEGDPIIYLDNGATTQRPRQVIERVDAFYREENANPLRGTHRLALASTLAYEKARAKVAKFINAPLPREIIFTRNTTESLNLLAYSYGMDVLKEGDEILISRMEHHSNSVPWQFVAKRTGAKLVYAEIDEDYQLDMEDFTSKLNDKTKIVSITGASNVLSSEPDVKEIARLSHEVGAIVICDAAQLVPHHVVDVQDLGVDFLVFSGHKMLAPFGIGVLWGKSELLEEMRPFLFGGEMIEYVYDDSSTFAELPYKFEAGTQNVGGAVGLAAAIDYINEIGMEHISEYEKALAEYCAKRMFDSDIVKVYHPKTGNRGAAVAFNVCGVHPHDTSSILDNEGIAVRAGHHCAQQLHRGLGVQSSCRASFAFYNTKEEIDKLMVSLENVLKTMGYLS